MTQTFTPQKITIFLLLVLCSSNLFAQTNLQAAWKAFFENKRDEARTLFNQAVKQNTNAGEAQLALSLLSQADQPQADAFNYFKSFCSQSTNPQPYIYALWTTESINGSNGKKTADQLAWLRAQAAKTEYDGTIAAMVYSTLGKHFESSKKIEQADKEYAGIGSIMPWAMSAEFENISTSGFDKNYDIVNHPEDTASFKNKNGFRVAWHGFPYARHDRWIDFTYYANAYNSIVFAQTFVQSPAETEAQLRIGVSGSLKVWVNDQLILTEADERNNDLDTYIQTIKLNKGYNRILVQVGESYAERSNFMVRLTDNKGYVLPGLTYTAKAQPYTKETSYVSKKVEPFAVAYFTQQIKNSPDDYLAKIMLAQTYLREDRASDARRVIEGMRKTYPNSTYLNTLLLNVFAKEDNRTGTETIKETIKMADPESSMALSLKYQEYVQQKDYTKAEATAKRIEALYPGMEQFIYLTKLNLGGLNNNQDEVVKVTEEAYRKFPDNESFVNIKYLIEANIHKSPSQAIAVLKKYTDNNDNYNYSKELASLYFNMGNTSAGYQVFLDEIKNDPIGIGIYSNLAELYYKQQLYAKAAETYLNCINIAPTNGRYYTALAKVYEMSNEADKAIAYYKKSLELDPSNYTTIKSLRKLQGKKDVYSYFKEPDVSQIIAKAPKASDYPDDNVVILNDEIQKVVYENGGSEAKRYLVVKMLNQKGIDDWKEYSVGSDNWESTSIETAQVIKANGNKIPAEQNDNSMVFTNLEVGDVISICYKTEYYYKGRLANHFWDSFSFTRGYPSLNYAYSLLISKNKTFSSKFSQQPIEPVKQSFDEFDLYVWNGKSQKSLSYEDKMPAFADVSNIFYVTSIPDWKYVAEWYNDMASAKARTNYEVKQAIAGLFDGKTKLTDLQKVQQIYNYITSNISYSSVSFRQSGLIPQNPSTVLNTRIGDCKDLSTLFVAMCKEAGIKSQLVLVKTRDNGLLSMPLPNIDFNHCIAKTTLNNQDYYIELTSQYLPFSSMYNASVNSLVLDVDGNVASQGIKYLNPTNRKPNIIDRRIVADFSNKDFVVKEKTYRTAALAGDMRETYRDLSAKDQVKKMKEAIGNQYADNEVTLLNFGNLDGKASRDTLYQNVNYTLKNITKDIAGMRIFSIPWSDKATAADLQVSMPRYSGIDLSQLFYVDKEVQTVTLTLPVGKKVIEGLKPVALANDVIDYSLVPTLKGNKLVVTRTLKVKKDFIPVDRVAEFNTFYKQIVDADNKELAIK